MKLIGWRAAVEDANDAKGFVILSSQMDDPHGTFAEWVDLPATVLIVMKYFDERNPGNNQRIRDILMSTNRYWQFKGPKGTGMTNGNETREEIADKYTDPVIVDGKATDDETYYECIDHMMALTEW